MMNMKTSKRIIGAASALFLLAACSPKEENTPSVTSTSAAASVSNPIASVATSSAPQDVAQPATMAGQETSATESSVLMNTYWKLTELEGTAVTASPHQREANIVFNLENRVTGSDGCNSLSGTYTIESEQLTLSELTSTKMACEEGGEQADAFRNSLGRVSGFNIQADQLELLDDTGAVLARFTAVALP